MPRKNDKRKREREGGNKDENSDEGDDR